MKKYFAFVAMLVYILATQLVNAQSVTITPNPNPPNICSGQGTNVSLTSVPAGGIVIGYAWSNGGNTQAINVSPLATTTYTVTVTFMGGLTANASQAVTVLPAPTPTITSIPVVPTICAGQTVQLNSSLADSYQWYLNGSIIPGATSQSYTASLAGTYAVYVVVGACSGMSANTVVTVNPLPVANVTPNASQQLCWGTSVTLTADPGVGYTFQWRFSPNGLAPWNDIVGETNQTYNANISGYVGVEVTLNGCKKTSY
jgi:hypothetical protein